jgi:hypothetical protein
MKKHVQELHKENDKYNDVLKLQLVHKYDPKLKSWEFQGYRCKYCDQLLMYPNSINKHPTTCRELNKVLKRVVDEPKAILTKDNKVWKPLDFSSSSP